MEAVYLRLEQAVLVLVSFPGFGELQHSGFQIFEMFFLAVSECALRGAVLSFAFLDKMLVFAIFMLVRRIYGAIFRLDR